MGDAHGKILHGRFQAIDTFGRDVKNITRLFQKSHPILLTYP